MPQPREWIDEVVEALEELGGHAYLSNIYARILARGKMDFSANSHWQDRIRETIQSHSSDSETFKRGQSEDLFYSVEGKGKGHWGLRSYSSNDVSIDKEAEEDLASIAIEGGIVSIEMFTGIEGGKRQRYVNYYERKKSLRAAAIRIHGTICKGCGFDFWKFYGDRGAGYIEVHHLRPVSSLLEETEVSPADDMTVLCANCHRMVHRNAEKVLTIAELREIVASQPPGR